MPICGDVVVFVEIVATVVENIVVAGVIVVVVAGVVVVVVAGVVVVADICFYIVRVLASTEDTTASPCHTIQVTSSSTIITNCVIINIVVDFSTIIVFINIASLNEIIDKLSAH